MLQESMAGLLDGGVDHEVDEGGGRLRRFVLVIDGCHGGADDVAGLEFAPLDGQFYLRPSPDAPPFVTPGQRVEPGATIGLIEVMKFYYPVRYEGTEPFTAGDYLLPNASPVSAGQGLIARA